MSGKLVERTRALILGSLIVLAAACGAGGGDDFITPCCGTGGTGGDVTPPTVAAVNPTSGTTNVPTNALITVTFSENVDSASVTNTAFALSPGVTGTISVSGATAVFTPSPGLPPSTVVSGTISNVRDVTGNVMTTPFSFSFTTSP
jgi:hypothetical protein